MDAKQIEQMSLFSGLDERERPRVGQHADEVDVSEGERLAREGDLAHEFFVIREGPADVDVGGEVKNELGRDDFVGEIGVLDEERLGRATSPMKLVVMSGHDLRAAAGRCPRSSTSCGRLATTASAAERRRQGDSRAPSRPPLAA